MSEEQEAGTDVINWEEKLAEEAKEVAKLERPALTKIGFRGGIMTYMGSAVPDNELQCIVAAYGIERVLYESKWDANKIVPPDCYALASPMESDDMVPADNVPHPRSEHCESCEFGQWDDNVPPKCKERRRLVILPKTIMDNPAKIATAEMALMSLPVTSIKNWGKYVNAVAAMSQRPYWAVLTKVSLKPHAKHQFHVNFEMVETLETSLLGGIQKLNEAAMQVALQPYDMAPPKDEEPKKKGKKAKY